MSKYNTLAQEPEAKAITQAFVRSSCPLTYIYAPSERGKTTLLGTLFKHVDYHPVLFIDGDQGDATIAEWLGDERMCLYRKFDKAPEERLAWMFKHLDAAKREKCGAIVLEGMTALHSGLVAAEVKRYIKDKGTAPTGQALWNCYGPASSAVGPVISEIRDIKQYRISTRTGVPIFVTLNTKIEQASKDTQRFVPDWSDNCIYRCMRTTDAHIQLTRSPSGTKLVTVKDEINHPYCKMRNDAVAQAVMKQTNLSLPGLLTLWATTIHKRTQAINEKTQQYYASQAKAETQA